MSGNQELLVFLKAEFIKCFKTFELSAKFEVAADDDDGKNDNNSESLLQLKYVHAPLASERSQKGNNLFCDFCVTISAHLFDIGFLKVLYMLTYIDEDKRIQQRLFFFESISALMVHVTNHLRIIPTISQSR